MDIIEMIRDMLNRESNKIQSLKEKSDRLREIISKKDEALKTVKDDIAWLISGGLNSSGEISIGKEQANNMYNTAQQALKIG